MAGVPNDGDLPFKDIRVVNETCRIPWFRFLLDFLALVVVWKTGTRSCRLKRDSEALDAIVLLMIGRRNGMLVR